MRVVVAGTRSFGAEALRVVLDEGHTVPLVVAPFEDKLGLTAEYDLGIPTAHEMDWRQLADVEADVVIGAHTHAYIGQKSRAATRYGALIGHPSLLPRHRGRDSVEWTIRMKDPVAGFTWFWADRGIDTGPVASQDWCHVDPRWNASDLWRERLFPMGLELLRAELRHLQSGNQRWLPQESRFATFEPSIEAPPLYRPELTPLPPGRGR